MTIENLSFSFGGIDLSILEKGEEPGTMLATLEPGENWAGNLRPNLPLPLDAGNHDPPPGDLLKVTSGEQGAVFRVTPLMNEGVGHVFRSSASPYWEQTEVERFFFEAPHGRLIYLFGGWMFLFGFYVVG